MIQPGTLAEPHDPSGEEILTQVSSSIDMSLDQLDKNLTAIVRSFETLGPDASAEDIIGPFVVTQPGVIGTGLIAENKTLSLFNASYLQDPQDLTMLQDPSVSSAIQYIKPRMSLVKKLNNSEKIVLISRPALVNDIIGAAVMVLTPGEFIDPLVKPQLNDTNTLCAVMQLDGTILYTSHPMELSNIPPENFMTGFPTFRDVIGAMIDGESGDLIYELWRADRTEPKARQAFWTTITQHGTDWRIMVAVPIR